MKYALILMTRLAFLTLLFESSRAQHGEQLDAQSGATDLVFLIDRDGSNERRIGEGRWPDWSPDGKQDRKSVV